MRERDRQTETEREERQTETEREERQRETKSSFAPANQKKLVKPKKIVNGLS